MIYSCFRYFLNSCAFAPFELAHSSLSCSQTLSLLYQYVLSVPAKKTMQESEQKAHVDVKVVSSIDPPPQDNYQFSRHKAPVTNLLSTWWGPAVHPKEIVTMEMLCRVIGSYDCYVIVSSCYCCCMNAYCDYNQWKKKMSLRQSRLFCMGLHCVRVFVCVCVCERERESVCVCAYVQVCERLRVNSSEKETKSKRGRRIKDRDRKRERMSVCACVRDRKTLCVRGKRGQRREHMPIGSHTSSVCVCVQVCVCVCEREREREREENTCSSAVTQYILCVCVSERERETDRQKRTHAHQQSHNISCVCVRLCVCVCVCSEKRRDREKRIHAHQQSHNTLTCVWEWCVCVWVCVWVSVHKRERIEHMHIINHTIHMPTAWMRAYVCMCVYLYVRVRERDREREGGRDREKRTDAHLQSHNTQIQYTF